MALWRALLKIRPAQLGALLKRLLGIERVTATDRFGHSFWVDPVSVFGLRMIERHAYEDNLSHIVREIMQVGGTFIDVGAAEGYFSILAAAISPAARVLAIEPQSRMRPVIERNLELNGLHNVHVVQAVLVDRPGTARLYLRPSSNTGASSLFRYWRLGTASEEVVAMTLDSLMEASRVDRCKLIKLDCEGAEGLVIRGAASTLEQHRADFLALEYHRTIIGPDEVAATDRMLRRAGYRYSICLGVGIYHLPGGEATLRQIGPTREDCPVA